MVWTEEFRNVRLSPDQILMYHESNKHSMYEQVPRVVRRPDTSLSTPTCRLACSPERFSSLLLDAFQTDAFIKVCEASQYDF